MVKVACHLVNGLMLNLFASKYDDGTGDGVKMTWRDGPGVRLTGVNGKFGGVNPAAPPPGITEVDDAWWAKWLEQNKQNPILTQGVIHAVVEPGLGNPT